MADQNTSLPVRTESAGDIIAKLADATTPSQQLAIDASGRVVVKIDDGNGNLLTSQANGGQRALDVGINVAGVQIDPTQIRALTSSDVVTANQGSANTHSNAWFMRLTDGTNDSSLDAAGQLLVVIESMGSVAGGTAGAKSNLAGAQYNTALPTLTNGQQAALQVDSSGRLLVGSIASSLPAGTNNVGKVSIQDSSGSAFSTSNPLPVYMAATGGGSLVNKYNTSAAVAAAASVNHDYSVTSGKTFTGRKFHASASGKIKAEVQTSPDGTTFTSFWVAFNSTAMPNIEIDLGNLAIQDTGVGAKVRIILTNEDKAAMDVYSTISGTEV